MNFSPTPEQQAIIDAAVSTNTSLMIQAYAGCSKTTTLQLIARALSATTANLQAIALAFNKKIAKELESRFPPNFQVMTLNGLGHRAWAKAIGRKLELDEKKLGKLVSSICKDFGFNPTSDQWVDLRRLVTMAMQQGLVPSGTPGHGLTPDTLETWEDIADANWIDLPEGAFPIARAILEASIRQSYQGVISFDDQIYMSCQPAGTKVSSFRGVRDISSIKEGDEVMSFDRRVSKFTGAYNHGSKITGAGSRSYSGIMYEVFAGDKQTQATKEHKWLVRFKPGLKKQDIWFTYLMKREGSFKIGLCQIKSVRPDSSDGLGLAVRCALEKAEEAWILGVHQTLFDARVAEEQTATKFGITKRCFNDEIGRIIHTQQSLQGDIYQRAKNCLTLFNRDLRFPFWRENATRAFNSNFITESCNLLPDIMEVPTYNNTPTPKWESLSIDYKYVTDVEVFSLKVHRHELYIADGILTHNSLFGGVFPRAPLVLVDESQDLSPLNHIQIKRTASDRIIAVGDDKQAIYAFRGADSLSMKNLRRLREEWIDLPLRVTFRCPRVLVERQKDHAPGFTAFEKNSEGLLAQWLPKPEEENFEGWNWEKLSEAAGGRSIAILCRNNAPLLGMAFKLLAQHVGCVMLGRDIGKGLIALVKKILPDPTMPRAQCAEVVESWMNSEKSLAFANGQEKKAEGIEDRGECLLAVLEAPRVETAGDLLRGLQKLFERETGLVTLSTGHRAKGLEWNTVVHLDPWRIPSKFSRANPAALEQELNIKYVIETRAQQTLILANKEDFE